jgi:nicotinamidase/pyrazinamidase
MKRALVVVDLQVDFCEGGALPVTGGNQVAEDVAVFLGEHQQDYEVIAFTQDWHSSLEVDSTGNCGHFAIPPAQPDYVMTWPSHCLENTDGAELHPAILAAANALRYDKVLRVRKGQGVPGYSAFDGSLVRPRRFLGANLGAVLNALDIEDIEVVGLAYEHCVQHTALDAVRWGDVIVRRDLCAAANPNLVARVDRYFRAWGVEIV